MKKKAWRRGGAPLGRWGTALRRLGAKREDEDVAATRNKGEGLGEEETYWLRW